MNETSEVASLASAMIQKSTLSKTAENKSTSSPWPDSARRKMSFT